MFVQRPDPTPPPSRPCAPTGEEQLDGDPAHSAVELDDDDRMAVAGDVQDARVHRVPLEPADVP
jgi:hypothetical protein